MSKVKSDADILALFDRISAEVKKAGPGTRKARALAPAYKLEDNEWDLSAVFAAEIEERKQWHVTGLVLLQQEQRCICGGKHVNNFGVYTREKHRNGSMRLRRPEPNDYTAGEILPRTTEWMEIELVHDCPTCFYWGEPRAQHDFPFEENGEVSPELVGILTTVAAELTHHTHTEAPKHTYFTQEGDAREHSTEDAPVQPVDDATDEGLPEDAFDFLRRHEGEPGAE